MPVEISTPNVDHEWIQFPSGEPHVRVRSIPGDQPIVVTARWPFDFVQLALAKQALDDIGANDTILNLPFVPCARQDRVAVAGDVLAVKTIGRFVNELGFRRVVIVDPHSDVAAAVIDQSSSVSVQELFDDVIPRATLDTATPVIPDMGASKRFAWLTGAIQATKKRDPTTGRLSGFDVLNDSVPAHCLIVDDICDGGGTFRGLADVLRDRGAERVDLYVTHGLFTKGVDALTSNGIDHIFTTDSTELATATRDHERVTVTPLHPILKKRGRLPRESAHPD